MLRNSSRSCLFFFLPVLINSNISISHNNVYFWIPWTRLRTCIVLLWKMSVAKRWNTVVSSLLLQCWWNCVSTCVYRWFSRERRRFVGFVIWIVSVPWRWHVVQLICYQHYVVRRSRRALSSRFYLLLFPLVLPVDSAVAWNSRCFEHRLFHH